MPKRVRKRKQRKLKKQKVMPFLDLPLLTPMLKGPIHDHHREGQHLHVSDLIGKCVRKIALAHQLEQTVASEPVFDGQGLTFAMGDAVHDYIRDKIAERNPDKVYGMWQCVCKKHKTIGTLEEALSAGKCSKCRMHATSYNELTLRDDELMIVGNVDLTMRMGNGAFYLSEIKSMAKSYWVELTGVVPSHLIQILFYWFLAQRKGIKLVDQVSVLYALKEYSFKSPYKEYIIRPSEHLHRLDDYLEDAEAYADFLKGGPLPPRVICPSSSAPAAKKCQVCTVCFNL